MVFGQTSVEDVLIQIQLVDLRELSEILGNKTHIKIFLCLNIPDIITQSFPKCIKTNINRQKTIATNIRFYKKNQSGAKHSVRKGADIKIYQSINCLVTEINLNINIKIVRK